MINSREHVHKRLKELLEGQQLLPTHHTFRIPGVPGPDVPRWRLILSGAWSQLREALTITKIAILEGEIGVTRYRRRWQTLGELLAIPIRDCLDYESWGRRIFRVRPFECLRTDLMTRAYAEKMTDHISSQP